MKYAVAAVLIAGLLCQMILFTGCGQQEEVPSVGQTSSAQESENTPVETSSQEASSQSAPAADVNPLTGEADLPLGQTGRPVAVMIANNTKARPQYGLEYADWYLETETEGGISRIMAVFANSEQIPAQLGPVRSARTPFVKMAQSMDAIYCHAGGSIEGMKTVQATGINHIDGLVYEGTAYWRDKELRATKGLEYSLMTSGDKMTAKIGSSQMRNQTERKIPFAFGTQREGDSAQKIQVSITSAQTVSFVYQGEKACYLKSNGSLTKGTPHVTASGTQLSAANIVVLYDTKYMENEVTISYQLKSGTGLAASQGKSWPVYWKRTADGLSFTYEDGSPLQLSPGKTYICLTAKQYEAKTVVQ